MLQGTERISPATPEEAKQIGPRIPYSCWKRLHQCAYHMDDDMQDVIVAALNEYFDKHPEADMEMSEKAWKKILGRRKKRS